VRRLSVEQYVERRWSPRQGWLVLLTPKGRDLVREFTDDE
jgi:DNA-binding MarR family transcriptional regulator